jgi:peptide/nickel transport system permease protein
LSAPTGRRPGWLRTQWKHDRSLIIWGGVLLLLVLVSLLLPLVLAGPNSQDPARRLEGPSADYLFGTDNYGRDLLSRAVNAGRISLMLGAIVTVTSIVLGTFIGLIAGYYRFASAVLMRLMDALMAFPVIVLAISLVVVLGSQNGVLGEVIALTVVFSPYVARVVRSRTVSLAERGFVTAARASGVSGMKILVVHILPNALPAIMVQGAFVYASALLADASLSFLGLGVAPPTATWGNMIAEARPYMTSVPLTMIVPGLAIVIVVMALNMVGDSVRALIDPRAKAVLSLNSLRRHTVAAARKAARVTVKRLRPATSAATNTAE